MTPAVPVPSPTDDTTDGASPTDDSATVGEPQYRRHHQTTLLKSCLPLGAIPVRHRTPSRFHHVTIPSRASHRRCRSRRHGWVTTGSQPRPESSAVCPVHGTTVAASRESRQPSRSLGATATVTRMYTRSSHTATVTTSTSANPQSLIHRHSGCRSTITPVDSLPHLLLHFSSYGSTFTPVHLTCGSAVPYCPSLQHDTFADRQFRIWIP